LLRSQDETITPDKVGFTKKKKKGKKHKKPIPKKKRKSETDEIK
jgi:hypothetical protein